MHLTVFEGSSEEGLTELRIRRSYGPILFADWGDTLAQVAVEINKEVYILDLVTKSEQVDT